LINFINFIIEDGERNEKKIYYESNKNILFKSKFTKFKAKKYTEKNEKILNDKLKI
jgi:hypothetical protein